MPALGGGLSGELVTGATAHDPSADAARRSAHVVLLNWNDTANTLECLESLRALTFRDHHVVVIDNASRTPCTVAVAERFPEVEVIESTENLGFAGGCNLGIRLALARGADYVWLLNNDTVVHPSALTELVKVAEADAAIGIVGSKILFYGPGKVIDHAGGYILPRRCAAGHIGIGEEDIGQYDEIRPVDFITGCSLMVTRETVEDVGLLDDKLFAYWEDVDWCTRARRGGWEVMYVPGSVIRHKGGNPSAVSPLRYYLMAINSLRYTARHHPRLLPITLPRWIGRHLVRPLIEQRSFDFRIGLAAFRDWVLVRDGGPPPHVRS